MHRFARADSPHAVIDQGHEHVAFAGGGRDEAGDSADAVEVPGLQSHGARRGESSCAIATCRRLRPAAARQEIPAQNGCDRRRSGSCAICSAEIRVLRDSPEPLSMSMPCKSRPRSRPHSVDRRGALLESRRDCPNVRRPRSAADARAIKLLLNLLVRRTISPRAQRVECEQWAGHPPAPARRAACR